MEWLEEQVGMNVHSQVSISPSAILCSIRSPLPSEATTQPPLAREICWSNANPHDNRYERLLGGFQSGQRRARPFYLWNLRARLPSQTSLSACSSPGRSFVTVWCASNPMGPSHKSGVSTSKPKKARHIVTFGLHIVQRGWKRDGRALWRRTHTGSEESCPNAASMQIAEFNGDYLRRQNEKLSIRKAAMHNGTYL